MNFFKSKILNHKSGFTLIELLVVISIIGILASLTLVSYTGAQKQTRDTQRRSDLNQYRNALESYAASNSGAYPVAAAGVVTSICGTGKVLEKFIASCPADPVGGTYVYKYWSDGTDFTLWGGLETGGFWKICSNGKSGKSSTDSESCDL
jgi:prepilin-type N-terminal cleavage/methylation domain-containing protein